MVSSAIIPSWEAAGQQALVWLEIRLPSPNTTGLPLMVRIGWTTWTCWPTIAVISRERVSLPGKLELAGARLGDILIAPVDVDDDRLGAARRARAASARIVPGWPG